MDDQHHRNDDDEKTIVVGLFGVANQENTSDSSCSKDEVQMEVKDNIIDHEKMEENVSMDFVSPVDNQTNCNQVSEADLKIQDTQGHSEYSDKIQLEISNNTTIDNEKQDTFNEKNEKYNDPLAADNNCFGNHLLSTNSEDCSKSEIPSSFALISEIYEKSKKDDASTETVASENQTTESNSKSVVVLSKGSLPSTLSMISANYQDSSSDDDSDDSSVVSVNDVAVDSDDEISIISIIKDQPVKTRGELDISELPPIEDLKISVDEAKCQPVGCIKNIVETLVIVEAFLNQPALDIDSVLFVDRGQRAIGRIFDVFGPVNKPYYAVRFNNSEHIKKFDIHIKEPVYCAPQTEYASFVMVSQLLEMKGSDASWRHNNEPPCEHLDYSDDEAEKLAKKKRRQKRCADSEDNNTVKKDKSPDPPAQNIARRNVKPNVKPTTNNASKSFANNSPRPSNTYSPRPSTPNTSSVRSPNPNNFSLRPPNLNNFNHPPPSANTYSSCPPNHNYGPRQFPTYAQQLSSMDYSHSYRQPYNPYYYDQNMYPPRHSYPYQHPYRPPGYDYRSPPLDPNNPNHQYLYPEY